MMLYEAKHEVVRLENGRSVVAIWARSNPEGSGVPVYCGHVLESDLWWAGRLECWMARNGDDDIVLNFGTDDLVRELA